MPIYLIHGFRWQRNQGHHGIGPYIIMNNVLDAAVNYTMTESSSAALIESLRAQHPDIMAQLPNIRLVEQGSLENGTQPYAYLCDTVVEHDLSIDLTGRLQPSAGSQWNAMSDLIDVLAPGARLGWYVVHNDDPFRGGNPPVAYKDTEQARAGSGERVHNSRPPRPVRGEQAGDDRDAYGGFEHLAFGQLDVTAKDSNGNTLPVYSPSRPPAIPLAVRSPYTSAWSSTSNNGTLNTNGVIFWPGTPLGWEGIVTVDGTSYEYLGTGSSTLPTLPNLKPAIPLTVSYDSQYSNFTFGAGPMEITASFLSSVLPKDLCRTSIPLSYLTTSVRSTDNDSHSVQFYSDVNAAWVAYENNVTTQWTFYEGSTPANGSINATNQSSIYSWFVSLENAYEFAEEYGGNLSYSTSSNFSGSTNFSYQSGYSSNLQYQYVMKHSLQDFVDPGYRPFGTRDPAFAFAHDFGTVSSASVMYTIGEVQQPTIRYLTSQGVESLQPWWTQCYGDIFQMINFHFNDFSTTQQLASRFEVQLKADVDSYYRANMAMVYSNSTIGPLPFYSNGSQTYTNSTDQYGDRYIFDPNNMYGFLNPYNFSGVPIPDIEEAQAYYSIVALSTRQIMGAYVLTVPPSGGCSNGGVNVSEPLFFQKEISSDGNVNTVDVLYPAMPFFLYANPELLRYSLEPLFQNQESGFYPNGYSMHDLGTNFPNATGHVEGNDEYMPVEESGNMILMTYAYYKFSGNSAFVQQHYAKLQQFASYLIEYSLLPGLQVSTDDFAGALVNQTNLAIKGIVGIQAMSFISTLANDSFGSQNYSTTARSFYSQWEGFAIDPSEKHTMLAYQWRSTYSLLYNTYPDVLLDLNLIPNSLYDMQSTYYPTVSQVFGIPLDSRHSYTKSDESMWTAATCTPETRRLFVNALGYWLNETTTQYAFTDLYDTIDMGAYPVSPNPVTFIARPVAGGHFSLLALERKGQLGVLGTGFGTSENSTTLP
ncbi:hypothetical protein HO133_010972 [Letharia lupina]|uniref:DUF1793-domain-containing protein n=1 Tax=Letharia lupina TaxID=560253 RepID=A0A8H6CJC3_9LECA|nr:uncharacterized protein HO133_010972 [Letharia lupina]KAF6224395.1 hypothetical protein HO133_010972 [Letharia lupina]